MDRKHDGKNPQTKLYKPKIHHNSSETIFNNPSRGSGRWRITATLWTRCVDAEKLCVRRNVGKPSGFKSVIEHTFKTKVGSLPAVNKLEVVESIAR